MAVIFKTFDLIEIDGIVAGNIVDVISNHGPRRAEVLAAYGVYVASLQAAFESEKLQLTTNLATLTNTVTENNLEIAAKADIIKSLTDQNQSLSTELATANATIIQLQSEDGIEWNHRWIDPEKFVERFTSVQTRRVYTSTDETLVGARQLLDWYIEANYQVVLDDPQVTELIDYMILVGILTEQDREKILQNSNSFERYTVSN